MSNSTLHGIIPIVFVPFDSNGQIDEPGLRRVVRFELEGGVDGLGVNGFASEGYKLTDQERRRTAEIVADEISNAVPLVIGLAAGSTEAAIGQMGDLERLEPRAFMVLPPSTMDYGSRAWIEHYVNLGDASRVPIMVQHSPHIPCYAHVSLEMEDLAQMAGRSSGISYFKIEGPGAPQRMAALGPMLPAGVRMFGGVGGLSFLDELAVGVAGVIPGVGFNEVFQAAWRAGQSGDMARAREVLLHHQPLVQAVSGKGHEFSLHARKHLAKRAGLISSATVRRPTVAPTHAEIDEVFQAADAFDLRISRRESAARSSDKA